MIAHVNAPQDLREADVNADETARAVQQVQRAAAARVVDAYCAGDSLVRAMLGLTGVTS